MTSGPEGSSPGGALPVDRLHSGALRIGVVSDTHGYLDPYILELFEGVDLIIHAGDVGDKAILESLGLVARTVRAVRAAAPGPVPGRLCHGAAAVCGS